jgi:hypothetical protein
MMMQPSLAILNESACTAISRIASRPSHEGVIPLPLSQPAVSEDPREGKRHVGQPFTPTYNQAVHCRRTRRPAYERQQIKPEPIPIIDQITSPPEFRDPEE